MALRTTTQNSFEHTVSIIGSENTVFVVPSFQRPFAWEEVHIDALKQDIIIANKRAKYANNKAFHYLSPIYLVKVSNHNDIIVKYIDQKKTLI
jgi:uncharacterized protein with ParB-like and HNH nuclease domain